MIQALIDFLRSLLGIEPDHPAYLPQASAEEKLADAQKFGGDPRISETPPNVGENRSKK